LYNVQGYQNEVVCSLSSLNSYANGQRFLPLTITDCRFMLIISDGTLYSVSGFVSHWFKVMYTRLHLIN